MLKSPRGRRVIPVMADSFMVRGVVFGGWQENRRSGREDSYGRDESVGVDGRKKPDANESCGLKSCVVADYHDVQGSVGVRVRVPFVMHPPSSRTSASKLESSRCTR